ncbi:Oligosaccharyl transferase STT3 subunit-domain-containing protein [Multifurca ochricompacta]|uniref:Dolichyl-diphosphooligosaccharide--protein glycosyltransferase subunit STT3 n=1 Tax=Multifurca ochricompacta TaxID=376703 RepID=A0AAD4M0B2_9AGAM|nr:Oligosaccharyl transferase STT3 subunit-domain-containing protein [Multifurca ochricompacta]
MPASLVRIIAFVLISGAAIASRLFAVINFESIIHEFDPWFNYRATKVLASKGFYEFWNWFDPTACGVIYNILHYLHLPVDIRNICVLLAPGFSPLTAWATYIFIGIVPGYISRSVAGSYDNEAIAIFLLMFTFFLWIKAMKQGSALYGTLAALFYFYMVAAWGGYAFITNMIPLHALVLTLMGRFTNRLYVAYSSWYAIGTLASMQVPFVGFQPVRTSEHMGALGVFGLLQIIAFVELVRSHVSSKQFRRLLFVSVIGPVFSARWIAPWTGRFYSLWTQATPRTHRMAVLLMDLHFLIFLFPAGVVLCFKELRDEHVFYFAGVMVRLMLTLTPIVCVSAAVALSSVFDTYIDPTEPEVTEDDKTDVAKKDKSASTPASGATVAELLTDMKAKPAQRGIVGLDTRGAVILNALGMLLFFVVHCTWVTSNAYSSPSVDGLHIIDDFREAYYWLRENTAKDAVVMSWWDYGYQIAGMADRPTLVDNNTWNNTHIATVGKAMSSPEEVAYPILRKHDVDYVLIIFGGVLGYSGDDINKFLWMVRIAQGVWPDEIQEPQYFTPQGDYRVDDQASPAMRNSLMYKMSYYRFAELFGGGQAQDRVRGQMISNPGPSLDYLEEAFTSENWIVRIYQVKKEDPLGRDLKSANAFNQGKKRKRTRPPVRRRGLVSI